MEARSQKGDMRDKFVGDKMKQYNAVMRMDSVKMKVVPEDTTPYLNFLPMPLAHKFFETKYMGLRRKIVRR